MKNYNHIYSLVMVFIVCFFGVTTSDAREMNYKCSTLSRMIEIEEGLPPLLLSAITFVESSDMPWVIGVEGVSHRFYKKEDAIKKIKELRAQNIKNFDVGCMQINHHFHRKEFASLEDMMHPVYNIRYAARLIKAFYHETKSWDKAIAYYNSRDLRYSSVYKQKVAAEWDKIKSQTVPSKDVLHLFANIPKEKPNVSLDQNKEIKVLEEGPMHKAKVAYLLYKRTLTRE